MQLENYGYWNCTNCPKCEEGIAQSPVNVCDVRDAGAGELTFAYETTSPSVTDTGKSIQFSVTYGGHVTHAGQPFTLQQFHFHCPGEHQINGHAYAMELHLVHTNADGQFLVVAVLIECGPHDHPTYAALWRQFPGSTSPPEAVNLHHLLPTHTHDYYAYGGSLTTPPCTENVQWVILAQTVKLSARQVDQFAAHYSGNNRPLQALNDRRIYHYR
jgi:carbonic anhydrase